MCSSNIFPPQQRQNLSLATPGAIPTQNPWMDPPNFPREYEEVGASYCYAHATLRFDGYSNAPRTGQHPIAYGTKKSHFNCCISHVPA